MTDTKWRVDLQLWENKGKFLFITYYKYSIRKGAKLKSQYSLFVKKRKKAVYFEFKGLENIKVGQKEFKEKYNENKWLVPLNYTIDLNLP